MEPDTPLSTAVRRAITVSLCVGLVLVWLFDLAAYYDPQGTTRSSPSPSC